MSCFTRVVKSIGFLGLIATLVFGFGEAASAQITSWTGATSDAWDVDTNWTSGMPDSGTVAMFDNNAAGHLTVYLAGSFHVDSIHFTGTFFDSVLIWGPGDLGFSNGISCNDANPAHDYRIAVDLWVNGGSLLPVDISGDASFTIAGGILDARLAKFGAGKLLLTGVNDRMTGASIYGGTLSVDSITSLSGDVTIDSGASLELTSSVNGTYSGRILGQGDVDHQGGTLTLSGDNSGFLGVLRLAGGTVIAGNDNALGSGSVTLALDSTLQSNSDDREIGTSFHLGSHTLTVSGNDDLNLTGTISDGGSLMKGGSGTLTLSGNSTYTGATTVSDGTLIVNGSLSDTSGVTVASGARLGGTGRIGSLVNNGIVAPGNSIGTLTLAGDYTINAGSTTEIEIDNAGNCDVIDVGGSVTIEDGATLKVVSLNGQEITISRTYEFMATTGGITGEFSILDTALIDLTAEVRGDNYYLTVTRNSFSDFAQTKNQRQIAPYLDRTIGSATGDYFTVLTAMQGLPTGSEVRNAMDQLDGELFPTLSVVNLQATSNLVRMIGDQLRPGVDGGSRSNRSSDVSLDVALGEGEIVRAQNGCRRQWTGWTVGYGLGGAARSDGNAHGYDYSTGGLILGIDRQLDSRTRFGLLYGDGFASTGLDGLAADSSIESHLFGAYMKRRYADWYSTTVFDMGFDDYESRRRITFGTIDRTAQSKHDGWQSTLYQEIGRTCRFRRNAYLQPYAALQYIYIRQDGFTETGADSIDLQVAGQDLNSLRTILGGRLLVQSDVEWLGGCELAFRSHWMHELLTQTTGLVTADLVGGGAPGFGVYGVDLGRDWVVLGPDIAWRLNDHIQLRAAYDLTFNADQAYHTGGGSLVYTW